MATEIQQMRQHQEQETLKTLPQLPDHVWYYIIGFLGIQQRLILDMLLIVTSEPRRSDSVFNAVGHIWCTNIYAEACRPKVPAAIKWLTSTESFRNILRNIRPTEDTIAGMWSTCMKMLRPDKISRIMAHDIMCVMCSVPWFREEYAEQLCSALSNCHNNAIDSSWPKSHTSKTGLQNGIYIEYVDEIYVRKRRAPFVMDDEGGIVPDFAHYKSDIYRRSVGPIVTYQETGEISLDIWLSIGSVFVAACDNCNLVAAKWLVKKFPDYFYDYTTSTCPLQAAWLRSIDATWSRTAIEMEMSTKYSELCQWLEGVIGA